MDNEFLPRDKKLRLHSTDLRNHATKQENHLWYDFLRGYSVHFNRQRIIGEYIVDFYCATAKLVIELDGSQHYEKKGMGYDRQRTEYLESLGLKVIRFTNVDVDAHFDGVCAEIDRAVKGRL